MDHKWDRYVFATESRMNNCLVYMYVEDWTGGCHGKDWTGECRGRNGLESVAGKNGLEGATGRNGQEGAECHRMLISWMKVCILCLYQLLNN